eukprot:CAMPEP_0197446926 /NCGR_PEP_ID=MMETSP1175-20131217/11727_1 /TAXON_ID=1003142 /ORGANISM="Triceratium dubium, Strain CCMP147" /LENGTH=406 /DNA_ID=CAMNT_0042978103 /DNA_START=140 /DNA_END=1360 /DNA_ORIENTATION=+
MMIRAETIVAVAAALLLSFNDVCCFQGPTTVHSPFVHRHRTATTQFASGLESPPTASDKEAKETTPTPAGKPCAYIENPSYADGTKPESAFGLGTKNFVRQGSSMIKEGLAQVGITSKSYIPPSEKPPNCLGFTLDDEAVRNAERQRESKAGGKVETNAVARTLYDIGCWALDELFPGRPIARFWFLETIARMPYFSYVSMLHLYESFGWWRDPELRKVHNAEEYNELHHLLIMEALGGNALWRDRFLGYHVAIGYYWAICALFFFSPKAAYEFMALLEAHAVDTYGTFFRENADRLKALPAPAVAMSYYKGADLYLFDDFQVSKKPNTRRPPCDSLYDVFKNISEDEAEHVKTMRACMDYSLVGKIVVSPHLNSDADGSITEAKRQAWLDWSEEVNRASAAEEDF